MGKVNLTLGKAEDCYNEWPEPSVIFCDGPYGLKFFAEDFVNGKELAEWYRLHIENWKHTSRTVLLFCGREISWASVHPVLEENGWVYKQLIVWDKSISHVAGRVNSETQRTFPIVTEVIAFYCRPPYYAIGTMQEAQEYLRSEWARTELPFSRANEACNVKNAATRKYLTADHLWYPPPQPMLEKLVEYANKHGAPRGAPYFSRIMEAMEGAKASGIEMRDWYYFTLPIGMTNVIRCSKRDNGHPNAKPHEVVSRLLLPFIKSGMVLWEPFGGTCMASIVAAKLGANSYAAEKEEKYYRTAKNRIKQAFGGIFK